MTLSNNQIELLKDIKKETIGILGYIDTRVNHAITFDEHQDIISLEKAGLIRIGNRGHSFKFTMNGIEYLESI